MVRGLKPYEWVPREVSDWNASSLLFHAHRVTERESAEAKLMKKLYEHKEFANMLRLLYSFCFYLFL